MSSENKSKRVKRPSVKRAGYARTAAAIERVAERPVDREAFLTMTRRRTQWVAVLRVLRGQMEEQGFKWGAVIGDV